MMNIRPGDWFRLPSGNVVKVVLAPPSNTLVCVYVTTSWRRAKQGVTLRMEWLQSFGVRA